MNILLIRKSNPRISKSLSDLLTMEHVVTDSMSYYHRTYNPKVISHKYQHDKM